MKAHLVDDSFMILLNCELEVGGGLKTRDDTGVMLVIKFNYIVPQILTTIFDGLFKVRKELGVPIDKCLEDIGYC